MTHKNLEVWNLSLDLVTDLYKITKDFPKDEIYGITSQIRRAAVSIPANIAEGAARNSKKEFKHFLYISLASASELDTLLTIAKNLKMIDSIDETSIKLTKISKMLQGLIKSLGI